MSTSTAAAPRPTHDRWRERQRYDVTDVYPYRDPETGRSPQAEFLAGPPGQADIVSDARNHGFVGGVGSGKTVGLILRAWTNAELWNPGELGMLVAPTVPALKNVILPEMRKLGLLDVCEYQGKGSEQPGIITPSGSRIILESADNRRKIERLRGPSLAWWGLDEAASIDERAYEILQGRLRAGEYQNAFVTTTPKGYNWVYERFHPDEATGVNTVLEVSSFANPHNADSFGDRLEAEFDGSFYEQEVLGAFTKFEGLVYPWFGADHLVSDRPDDDGYDEVIYGVDWGFNNPAVAIAVVRQGDRWVVVDEWYERRCTTDDHADALGSMVDDWGPGRVYCDPSEPSDIEEFRRRGFSAVGAENDVTPGIKHVASLRDDLRVHSSCQAVRNEFSQYQYKDDGEGDDPVKQNDHAMDALRYALFSHARGPSVRRRSASGTKRGNIME